MAMDDLSVSVLGRDTVCLPTDTGFSLEGYVLLLCIDVGQIYFLCRSILPEYVYTRTTRAPFCLWRPEVGFRSFGPGVPGRCELPRCLVGNEIEPRSSARAVCL